MIHFTQLERGASEATGAHAAEAVVLACKREPEHATILLLLHAREPAVK